MPNPLPLHIFVSYDQKDSAAAQDLVRQLNLAFATTDFTLVFWNKEEVPAEEFRAKAKAFLEKTNLFVAVLSMNYEDTPDVRWEAATAVEVQRGRPTLQILTVQARAAAVPAVLAPYKAALPASETIEQHGFARDRQLLRTVEAAKEVLAATPRSNDLPVAKVELPLAIEDVRERLLAQTDRINHAPLLALLKRLIESVKTKRVVLDIEEKFKQLREQTRLSQINIDELKEKARPIELELQHLIRGLPEADLAKGWKDVFIRDYFHFVPGSRAISTVPPFFVPADEIAIPDTLNLPVGPREQEALEQIGLLSFEQKSDFRRSLLLARDALAVKNYAQAYSLCDHVRTRIDPQSAQLYEYLLITFMQKETPERILREAAKGNDRMLQFVLLYAERYRKYQRDGKCPSSTGLHNLAIASESLSDMALRIYYQFPNDSILHTGKHAEDKPDNRNTLRIILDNTLKICRLVYPSEELLEAAVVESCGGGKYHWVKNVEVVGGFFQFAPLGNYDLLGEIQELLDMLQGMEADDLTKIVKQGDLLREDLYFSLFAKRQVLAQQIAEDEKRRRPYTDQRLSVVRFVHACLLGAEMFGDVDKDGRGQSFYRMALEYLLPELLFPAAQVAGTADSSLRWFDLDEHGTVRNHADCALYDFDAQAIVEKIVHDMAGNAGWLQVQPNIKEAVYLLFVADTNAEYEAVKKGLEWTDFRRLSDEDARRRLVNCLRRWVIAYRAYPERGRIFLENCVRELVGDGLMLWLHHDPDKLAAHPHSRALGYDAQAALKMIHDWLLEQHRPEDLFWTEEKLRQTIASNLYAQSILPNYERIKPGDERQRPATARLLREAMSNYRLHPEARFLDLVWRELTEERKFCWLNISKEGKETAFATLGGFDPAAVLRELNETHPEHFRLLTARERIADHRHANQQERYYREISEFRHENRRLEREIAIDIIRNIKGIYLYFPKQEYLELPLRELTGKGRIRWNAHFLGLFPLAENHYENRFLGFEYKWERAEIRRLLDDQFSEMQRVLRETGEM
ncbi:MAG: TIR domain-containing protein [Saprospiraceae bacterium]|nr:TIR domain-containing protein [Saprospiraceae bacterium]